MEYFLELNGKSYLFTNQIRDDENKRSSFNTLAENVFGLSFEKWYDNGYWRDKYFPYTCFDGEKAVANVSASKIHTLVDGEAKLYIQIGTVMTDPNYRNQGLSRKLMDELFKDFKDNCNGIYLYANDTVLEFYPKFGFEKAKEYQYTKSITPNPNSFVKLDMSDKSNIDLLESYYTKGNPFSQRPMLDNFGLLMFYCGNFMSDCVYYSEPLQTVVIASFKGEEMLCYEIFCNSGSNMDDILKAVVTDETKKVVFGFMPKETTDCECRVLENEDQLFVFRNNENMFEENKMLLPLLSHA